MNNPNLPQAITVGRLKENLSLQTLDDAYFLTSNVSHLSINRQEQPEYRTVLDFNGHSQRVMVTDPLVPFAT